MRKVVVYCTIVFCIFLSCVTENKPPIKETIYITIKDTISEKENIVKIAELEYKCNLLQDSLNSIKNSLDEDLFIAKYKLGRIKYYNDIAAKGNNIKYLRGWINRILNDE